jgi:Ca2+:H+ antiporter
MAVWTWLAPDVVVRSARRGELEVGVGALVATLCGAGLIAAVHHAEVVAHRVGEPFGTLVLAVVVTVIETSLILSMMLAGGDQMATLPRDAIYAEVMIICTGVVGLCVLVGGLAHHEQSFRVEGAGAGLAALIVTSSLTLVLPAFTTTTPGGTSSTAQLGFVAATSARFFGRSLSSIKRCAIGTTSSRSSERPTRIATPSHRRHARRGRASDCFSSRWLWSLASPRSSRQRSSTRLR